MGLYLETPEKFDKAVQLIHLYNAERISPHPSHIAARRLDEIVENGKVLVCVVDNLSFEAALIVGDKGELDRVATSIAHGDNRKLEWLLMDKEKVEELNPNSTSYFGWDR